MACRLKRLQKDKEVRVVYLRKHSCARTRTLEDTRDMENADLALADQVEKAQSTSSVEGQSPLPGVGRQSCCTCDHTSGKDLQCLGAQNSLPCVL